MSISRKSSPALSGFDEILKEVERDAPAFPRAERLNPGSGWPFLDTAIVGVITAACVTFCSYAVLVSANDPNYFSERLISSLQNTNLDPIQTGTVAATVPSDTLPVPIIARAGELKPEDYQIVMVFDDEAILATTKELFRVKVGSALPGLGLVKEIVPHGDGGMVAAEKATLKTVPN